MRFDKLDAITPTEYARDRYIDIFLSRLGGEVQSVCDIGCGVGNLLLVLEDRLAKAKGIDTSEESLTIARAKITSPAIVLEKKDAYELTERFDLILLTEVLEHVSDDLRLVKHLHDAVIRKGGYLIATVPARSRLYSRFDRKAGHYRRYDKAPLLEVLAAGGFEVLECWSYGRFIFHFVANAMLALERQPQPVGAETATALSERTRVSAIREFTGVTRFLVSRVSVIHQLCFVVDFLLRRHDLGIEHCVLCRAR